MIKNAFVLQCQNPLNLEKRPKMLTLSRYTYLS